MVWSMVTKTSVYVYTGAIEFSRFYFFLDCLFFETVSLSLRTSTMQRVSRVAVQCSVTQLTAPCAQYPHSEL